MILFTADQLNLLCCARLPLHIVLYAVQLPSGRFAPCALRFEFGLPVFGVTDEKDMYARREDALGQVLGYTKAVMGRRWLFRNGERFSKS